MTTNKQTLPPANGAPVVNGPARDEANMQPLDEGTANPLSEREMEVARLLVTGATNGQIANTLVISPHTVKVHVRNLFDKLQVSSRTEASMLLIKRGWVVMPGVEVNGGEAVVDGSVPSEVVAEEATLVLPEPLANVQAAPRPWQLGIVMTALAMALVALLLPAWITTPKSTIGLLSDSGQTILGKPGLNNLPYQWEIQPPLSQARSRLAAAEVDGRIYAVGGEAEDGSSLDLVEIYDLMRKSWRQGEPLPAPRANLALAVSGDALIVAGGSHNTDSGQTQTAEVTLALYDDMVIYHRAEDVWTAGGKLPMPLAGTALVAHGDSLYLMGGWNGRQMQDSVWQLPLDKVDDALPTDWQVISRLPKAAAWFGAVVVNDLIYVVGGYDGRYELSDFAAYDLASGEWRQLTPLTTPRGGVTLVYDGNTVLALGGGWTTSIQNHERYDAWTNQWTLIDSPITGEWRHFGAAASDGSVYILGGWSGAYLDTHLQFQSTFRALLPAIPNVREEN